MTLFEYYYFIPSIHFDTIFYFIFKNKSRIVNYFFLLDSHSNNEYNSIQWLEIYYDLFIIQKTDDEREFSNKNHFSIEI
jgi:hypothetical protein